jgi:hypothetical protein
MHELGHIKGRPLWHCAIDVLIEVRPIGSVAE